MPRRRSGCSAAGRRAGTWCSDPGPPLSSPPWGRDGEGIPAGFDHPAARVARERSPPLAWASPAYADDAGLDVVHSARRRHGARVRHAETGPTQTRIKLADGEVRVIAGELIERVELAPHSGSGQAAAPAEPATAPAPAPRAGDRAPTEPTEVRLHVEGAPQVVIEGHPGYGYDWQPVCSGLLRYRRPPRLGVPGARGRRARVVALPPRLTGGDPVTIRASTLRLSRRSPWA